MAGIAELKDYVLFVAKVGNAIGKTAEDGEVSLGDALNFIPVLPAAMTAFSGSAAVVYEAADMSEEELAHLVESFKSEFDLSQEDAEKTVEICVDVGLRLLKVALSFRKPAQ